MLKLKWKVINEPEKERIPGFDNNNRNIFVVIFDAEIKYKLLLITNTTKWSFDLKSIRQLFVQ